MSYGKMRYYNNDYYDGEFLGGVRHGSGTWLNVAGDKYHGAWKEDKKEGYGVL